MPLRLFFVLNLIVLISIKLLTEELAYEANLIIQ